MHMYIIYTVLFKLNWWFFSLNVTTFARVPSATVGVYR